MTILGRAWSTVVGDRQKGQAGDPLHPDAAGDRMDEGASEQPTVIKEWVRLHGDGSVGSVAAWSDGTFSGGHFEYHGRAGVQAGPRYPYDTLAEAFGGADRDAERHGHLCGDGCLLWRDVPDGE